MKIKREVKLAVTAIAAVIILIWGINFLKARAIFDKNNVFYGIYEQVDGLKVSSSVVYRGYHVGQVNSIRFIGERFDKVLVQFSIGKNLEIPSNSVAVIQNMDLMGSKAINILPGNSNVYAQSGDTLQSRIELGLMAQVSEQLQPLQNKAANILTSMDSVLSVIQDIFNHDTKGNIESSLRSIQRTLRNVENASGSLDGLITGQSDRISQILANINSITDNLRENNERISRGIYNMTDITDTLKAANIGQTLARLNHILLQVDSIAIKLNRGKGTAGEIINNDDLYYNLVAVSENLNQLLAEFRKNPKKFVNFSVFDFASHKTKGDKYGIVIEDRDKPLPPDSELLRKHPDLQEIKKNGHFLYLIRTYRNLKQAEKDLPKVKKDYGMSYIVKISES